MGRIPPAIARSLFKELLDGLEYIHSHKVFHRDIKPDNLLLDDDFCLKITDFGSAIGSDNSPVTFGVTAPYVAPEIYNRPTAYSSSRADLFAAGIVLYIMVSGHPPFMTARKVDPNYR